MFQKISRLAVSLGLVTSFVLVISAPSVLAAADPKAEIQGGVTQVAGNSGDPEQKVDTLVKNIVKIISWLVGVAAVIMLIYGGFRYVTSGGDSNAASTARKIIIYALVGLVIVAFAQVIVKYTLKQSTTSSDSSQAQPKETTPRRPF